MLDNDQINRLHSRRRLCSQKLSMYMYLQCHDRLFQCLLIRSAGTCSHYARSKQPWGAKSWPEAVDGSKRMGLGSATSRPRQCCNSIFQERTRSDHPAIPPDHGQKNNQSRSHVLLAIKKHHNNVLGVSLNHCHVPRRLVMHKSRYSNRWNDG
jgi:hypothetical protein